MFIDGVKVIADPVLSTEEIQYFVAEEKRLWQSKNKQLGQLEQQLEQPLERQLELRPW